MLLFIHACTHDLCKCLYVCIYECVYECVSAFGGQISLALSEVACYTENSTACLQWWAPLTSFNAKHH